jgi:hypothetical protein
MLVNWFIFDNITQASELNNRMGVWIHLCDEGTGDWPYGDIYENLSDPENPQYAVQVDNTFFLSDHVTPKAWNTDAVPSGEGQNNPLGIAAFNEDPLFYADDLARRQQIDIGLFTPHVFET